MNRRFRQYLRDFALAFLVVIAILIVHGELQRHDQARQVADAYKRGAAHGIMAGRAYPLSSSAQAQIVEICNQSWPDTRDGALARRRACGASPQIARVDQ